jgi:CRP/FNR family cyclic AMP-dependent transcriptional regulator
MMDRIGIISAKKKALASVAYFTGLDEGILAAIAGVMVERNYVKNEIVFLEGEPTGGMYIVQSGWLKGMLSSPGGREQIIRLLGPGETFNEHGVLLDEGINLVTVQAMEDSTLWVIERGSLLRLIEVHPALCRTIAQNLSKRVVHLMKLIGDLSLRTVDGRLARLLLEQTVGESKQPRWVTQADMAARLGTVSVVVNRALHGLEAEGLIRLERHRVEIIDRMGLERKAGTRD